MDNSSIFDFHLVALQLNGLYTTGKLIDDTIYRTGSIGKLLTIYAWLMNISDSVFLNPITRYIVSACSLVYPFSVGPTTTGSNRPPA